MHHIVKRMITSMMTYGRNAFLLDGWPKTKEQAVEFEAIVGSPLLCISLDAPDDILISRVCQRGQSSGRADDTEAAMKKRLDVYRNDVAGVREYYKGKGVLHDVDATQDKEKV